MSVEGLYRCIPTYLWYGGGLSVVTGLIIAQSKEHSVSRELLYLYLNIIKTRNISKLYYRNMCFFVGMTIVKLLSQEVNMMLD